MRVVGTKGPNFTTQTLRLQTCCHTHTSERELIGYGSNRELVFLLIQTSQPALRIRKTAASHLGLPASAKGPARQLQPCVALTIRAPQKHSLWCTEGWRTGGSLSGVLPARNQLPLLSCSLGPYHQARYRSRSSNLVLCRQTS